MSTSRTMESESSLPNPLDLVEEIVSAHDWPFDRCSTDEMVVDITGKWCDYHLHFAWLEDLSAMHFSCALDMKVPKNKRPPIFELLSLVNEKLWLGHFDIWSNGGVLLYRHGLMLGDDGLLSLGQAQFAVESAVAECDRFYPAFQFVLWGDKNPADALASALVDAAGEA